VIGATLVASVAGVAWGQGAAKVEGDLEKPMKLRQKAGGAGGQSVMSISRSDGGQTIEVRIEDGKVTSAKINGKTVPEDRIRHKAGKVEVLDEDGDVIQSFSVGGDPGAGHWFVPGGTGVFGGTGGEDLWRMFEHQPGGPGGPQVYFTPGGAYAPPKVMLGINMDSPDEETAKELEVEADEVIRISKVLEDLPADKAGLKEGDIVVKIAGKSPATPDKLREALKDKDPGDTIKLTVLREGDEKTLTIELAEYDASKLGVQVMQVEPGEGFAPHQFEWNEDAQKALEEAQKSYQEALKNFGQAQRFRGPNGEGMVFRRFGEGAAAGDARLHERLAQLNERMAEIDRRLGELDGRLERLTQKLEKLAGDRP
jgi:hypothetical protein